VPQILDVCEAWSEGRYHGLEAEILEGGLKPRQDLLLAGNIHPGEQKQK